METTGGQGVRLGNELKEPMELRARKLGAGPSNHFTVENPGQERATILAIAATSHQQPSLTSMYPKGWTQATQLLFDCTRERKNKRSRKFTLTVGVQAQPLPRL